MRPSLESFKQASSNAFSKAQLMVGLNNNSNQNDGVNDDIELTNNSNDNDDDDNNGGSGFRSSSFQKLFGNRGGSVDEESPSASERSDNKNNSERTLLDEAADLLCPELTFQQRLMGFAVCFTVAFPFAVNYTVGNLLAMSASGFLCGPKRQFRNMFDEKRRTVSIVYISCLCSTLLIVFIPLPNAIKLFILIILLITQCCANIWYSLSYVPYGRKACLNLIKKYTGLNTTGGGGSGNNGEGFMGIVNSGGELT